MHRHHLGPRGRPPSFRHITPAIGLRTSGRFDVSQKPLRYTLSFFNYHGLEKVIVTLSEGFNAQLDQRICLQGGEAVVHSFTAAPKRNSGH